MIKQFNNFLTKNQCENFLQNFKKNYLYFNIYNNTIIYIIKENFEERTFIHNFIEKMDLILNYDQIVMWPNNSEMMMHYDGSVNKDNEYTAICYLNNNYIGGRTIVENKFLNNNLGDLVVFKSNELLHGVEQVIGTRLVYISWWKSKI